jgi:hypothetical protein
VNPDRVSTRGRLVDSTAEFCSQQTETAMQAVAAGGWRMGFLGGAHMEKLDAIFFSFETRNLTRFFFCEKELDEI